MSALGLARAAIVAMVVVLPSWAGAQQQQQRPAAPAPRPASPPASTQAPPPAAAASGPSTRTEILTFDSWTVTCRDGREPTDKRACAAELQIVNTANNANQVVFSWLVGLNPAGATVSIMRFPPGVLIAPGVEFKLPEKEARKIPFTICEANRCEAAMVIDDAFIRDVSAAANAEATIYASDGRGVKFTITHKGFSQALAAIRK